MIIDKAFPFSGNPYLKEAFSSHANECNVAWIGDLPGIKVPT